jgi:epsin
MSSNILNAGKSLMRSAKNALSGFSDVQIRVRQATCSDAWGPSLSLLNELASMSHNG